MLALAPRRVAPASLAKRSARSVPSLQLAGWQHPRMVDLNSLSDAGVTLTGRFAGVNGGKDGAGVVKKSGAAFGLFDTF